MCIVMTRQDNRGQSKKHGEYSDHRDECIYRYESLCLWCYHVSKNPHPIEYLYSISIQTFLLI